MIVTVANHKGGVGKTSLAAHLAFRAAERGNKVLAVDFDAQGNLTGTLADRGKALKADGAERLFSADGVPVPMPGVDPNIAVLPATAGLNALPGGLVHRPGRWHSARLPASGPGRTGDPPPRRRQEHALSKARPLGRGAGRSHPGNGRHPRSTQEGHMGRKCQLTGKSVMSGNNVSHANNKTRRTFSANIHERRFWVASENRWVKLKISANALRTIDKNGIDAVLAELRASGVKV